MKFTELNLEKNLMKGIEDAEFSTLMPVQEETFVHSLKGKDVMVQSQTGTGKTAAFLITIFNHFLDKESKKNKQALILAPTRELAVQIEKDAKQLGRHLGFTIGSFYGGVGYHQQEKMLQKKVNVIIGTPGRLLDFNGKGKLDFRNIGFLVIDEADRMFDMGFYPDIRRIMRNAAPLEKRMTMLYSATLDVKTRNIAREFMNRPARIAIEPEQVTVDKITQVLYHVAHKEKLNLMLGVLKKELPNNALIFTNTKHAAAQVAKHLEFNGYKCLHISGDLPQSKRLSVIENFKEGKLPFLVATDVTARGLHIEGLELIINYDLPGDCENYVHRIGRTARAGKSGKAVSLACEDYIYNLDAIETYLGMKIPVVYAEDELYEVSKSEGMTFGIRKQKRAGEGDSRSRRRTAHAKPSGRGSRRPRPERERDEKRGPAKSAKPAKPARKTEPVDAKGPKRTRTRPDRKKAAPKSTKSAPKKDRKEVANLEDRLDYYTKKYGDQFKVQREHTSHHVKQVPRPKKSFFKKVKDVFRKK
ncbi:MAG: DEAD/DEAH box helicase [bacterium]|nr:DEAD/DEAH box helicase [bacterium]